MEIPICWTEIEHEGPWVLTTHCCFGKASPTQKKSIGSLRDTKRQDTKQYCIPVIQSGVLEYCPRIDHHSMFFWNHRSFEYHVQSLKAKCHLSGGARRGNFTRYGHAKCLFGNVRLVIECHSSFLAILCQWMVICEWQPPDNDFARTDSRVIADAMVSAE